MAAELRGLGLEGPAQAADRLAASVGPESSAVDGLNAFARFQQVLDAVRIRLLPPVDLAGRATSEVPGLPSLQVDSQSLAASSSASLWDYPADGDPVARYGYLVRVAERLKSGTVPPAGDGIAAWSNLQAGRLLVEALMARPLLALDRIRPAFQVRNLVVRRNVIRVLVRVVTGDRPASEETPAMRILASEMRSNVPLLALESLMAYRTGKGLSAWDPAEPYTGADGSGTAGYAPRVAMIRKSGGKVKPEDPWFFNPRKFGEDGLKEIQGPKGQVQERLQRTARFGTRADLRLRAMQAIIFLEDSAGIPCLREALHDSSPDVRRVALWGLGVLGDDSILPICRQHLATKTDLSVHAAMALGALTDSRGFPILWSAYERNLASERVPESLGFLSEAARPMLTELARNPTLMNRAPTVKIMSRVCGTGAPEALLGTLDAAGNPRAQSLLLKPFAASDLKDPAKTIASGLKGLLVRRIGDRSVPLPARMAAASHLRALAPDEADRLIAPVVANLTAEEASAFGTTQAKRWSWPRRKSKDAR